MQVGSLGRGLPPDPRHTHSAGATGLGDGRRFDTDVHSMHRVCLPATVFANADSIAGTRPIIRHTVCLAGVWGEASPQAPPEGARETGSR